MYSMWARRVPQCVSAFGPPIIIELYEKNESREEDMEESDIGRKHEGWSEQGRRHGRS